MARHYRVIRFDMRGMGQSAVPEPGYPFSVDNFAKDLAEFADKLGLEKFHLIGETVGGSISMRYATMHQGTPSVPSRLHVADQLQRRPPCRVRGAD